MNAQEDNSLLRFSVAFNAQRSINDIFMLSNCLIVISKIEHAFSITNNVIPNHSGNVRIVVAKGVSKNN